MNSCHFYDKNSNGQYLFCVGVPASFSKLKNVHSKDSFGVNFDIAQNYGFIGEIELKNKNYQQALCYFEKTLELLKKCDRIDPQTDMLYWKLQK